MSSTDPRAFPESASALFSQLVAAAAAADRAYFPTAPDGLVQSYYLTRSPDSNSYISEFDTLNLEETLRAVWVDRPELAALASSIAKLAELVDPGADEDDGNVSPFIYEMF